jgi:hypothetical protein
VCPDITPSLQESKNIVPFCPAAVRPSGNTLSYLEVLNCAYVLDFHEN